MVMLVKASEVTVAPGTAEPLLSITVPTRILSWA